MVDSALHLEKVSSKGAWRWPTGVESGQRPTLLHKPSRMPGAGVQCARSIQHHGQSRQEQSTDLRMMPSVLRDQSCESAVLLEQSGVPEVLLSSQRHAGRRWRDGEVDTQWISPRDVRLGQGHVQYPPSPHPFLFFLTSSLIQSVGSSWVSPTCTWSSLSTIVGLRRLLFQAGLPLA